MNDRAGEVVDHQLQDRLDLLLAVAGVVCEGLVPRATLEDEAGKVHGSGSDLAGGVGEEAVIQAADLEEVLAQCAGLDVVVVGL